MEAQKLKKIMAAAVSTGILLLFILLSVMVYQMLVIKNTKKRIDALNAEIARLEQENESTQDEIDKWHTDWKIEEKARELGYCYPEDK